MTLAALLAIFLRIGSGHALTLQEAKEEALRANFDIKISGEKVSEAQSKRKESYTKLFPEFSTNSGWSYQNKEKGVLIEQGKYGVFPFGAIPSTDITVATSKRDLYGANLNVQQTIFAGGRIYYSYRQAKSGEEESLWNEKQTIQEILFSVEMAYYRLLKAEDTKKFAEQHEDTLKAHLMNMQKLFEKGRVPLNDVLKVRVEVSRANEEVLKATSDVMVAKIQLNLILNRPRDEEVYAIPLGEPQTVALNIEEATGLAKSQNKALNSARTKRTTALFQRRVAEADYYPNITLTSGYFVQNQQPVVPNDWWSVMLQVNWSLWQWGSTQHKVSAAKAVERQVDYSILSLENQIAADVKNDFLKIEETDKSREVAKDAMEQAEENLRITKVGFNYGRKTSTDVLDAEELATKTRSESVQAFYDAHGARAHLRYVMGQMEKEDFLSGSFSLK